VINKIFLQLKKKNEGVIVIFVQAQVDKGRNDEILET
jgi:hypothetical protein